MVVQLSYLLLAERELEGLSAIAARVELLAILEGARVVDLKFFK